MFMKNNVKPRPKALFFTDRPKAVPWRESCQGWAVSFLHRDASAVCGEPRGWGGASFGGQFHIEFCSFLTLRFCCRPTATVPQFYQNLSSLDWSTGNDGSKPPIFKRVRHWSDWIDVLRVTLITFLHWIPLVPNYFRTALIVASSLAAV